MITKFKLFENNNQPLKFYIDFRDEFKYGFNCDNIDQCPDKIKIAMNKLSSYERQLFWSSNDNIIKWYVEIGIKDFYVSSVTNSGFFTDDNYVIYLNDFLKTDIETIKKNIELFHYNIRKEKTRKEFNI